MESHSNNNKQNMIRCQKRESCSEGFNLGLFHQNEQIAGSRKEPIGWHCNCAKVGTNPSKDALPTLTPFLF